MSIKEEILALVDTIDKDGIEELKTYLEESDYFTAPSSTKYHGCHEEGLAEHSLNVYKLLSEKNERYKLGLSETTVKVVSLFHDLCKVDFYKKATKNRKNKEGKWETYETYEIEDNNPLGHGEKSVMILMQFIDLTPEEMTLIRWHMGPFEPVESRKTFDRASKLYPAVVAMFTSDYEASRYLDKAPEGSEE